MLQLLLLLLLLHKDLLLTCERCRGRGVCVGMLVQRFILLQGDFQSRGELDVGEVGET